MVLNCNIIRNSGRKKVSICVEVEEFVCLWQDVSLQNFLVVYMFKKHGFSLFEVIF